MSVPSTIAPPPHPCGHGDTKIMELDFMVWTTHEDVKAKARRIGMYFLSGHCSRMCDGAARWNDIPPHGPVTSFPLGTFPRNVSLLRDAPLLGVPDLVRAVGRRLEALQSLVVAADRVG